MSAFVVSDAHISYLLSAAMFYASDPKHPFSWRIPDEEPDDVREAGLAWGPGAIAYDQLVRRTLTPETADFVGVMLLGENVKSVNFRYDNRHADENPEPTDYHFTHTTKLITALQVLKAIRCYEYQSCEHPKWEASEAQSFCQVLRLSAIAELPDYDKAEWVID